VSGRYDPAAADKIGDVMHEYKHGTLRSGGSGRRVRSRKQAIAIGISEARRRGYKVPTKGSAMAHRKRRTRKSKSYCSRCKGPHRYKHGKK
jgi:hypothetical protein